MFFMRSLNAVRYVEQCEYSGNRSEHPKGSSDKELPYRFSPICGTDGVTSDPLGLLIAGTMGG